ncbi:Myc-type basic helix-loop-helix (bHLH) domain [Arabidopsis thaliana x Arabidopsis arenosa]|uniref:Myc-type basic helix-loop-helix (BHLH) domain n=1 Tax=Arabidopsis thaliana x Arabidopsis arenosa TaxID=1240361 RepID=A0A8T1Y5J2_9BRAS|nr:Myc-type basic helix-loop-helix (bHLH) domain [Arabidopsis thaliana x Arabidopsis arenosa]
MDQAKEPKNCSESDFADDSSASSSSSGHNLRGEMVVEVKKEAVCSRKAEREKLRRDKLKEQFLELGKALDPNRPKSDKVSVLTDTIQMLKDVMNQVDRLKAEYATLSQESRELIQEKSELREEKATLKSDIEILNAQYQHRIRTMVPWIPHYSYPFPIVAITQGQSSFIPYSASVNPLTEQQASVQKHPSSSGASNKQDFKIKPLDLDLMMNSNHSGQGNDHKDDVGLELELKIHASSLAQQDVSGKEKKGSLTTTASSSNSYSSSQAVQDSSPGTVNDILKS